jgi:hypothetical protein
MPRGILTKKQIEIMNQNQEKIIQDLIAEFNRIENMATENTGFNLININPLLEKAREIEMMKANQKADLESWELMAFEEMRRVIGLLQKDLPNASIQAYGRETGHYIRPGILIRRNSDDTTHHDSCVNIEIEVEKESFMHNNEWYEKGIRLNYNSYSASKKNYATIGELVSDDLFLRRIRTLVL